MNIKLMRKGSVSMLEITSRTVGPMRTNCYFIYNDKKEALIIDPGEETDVLLEVIESLNLKPLAVLITHSHYDHIGSLDDIREHFQIEAYISPIEQEWLSNPSLNLSGGSSWMEPVTAKPAENELEMNQNYQLADFSFRVVPTPGHSPGSVSYIFEADQFVICGDTLFHGTIGRTDLPQADLHTLKNSIRRELFTLPQNYKVYPGHGSPTTIKEEHTTNPFFHSQDAKKG